MNKKINQYGLSRHIPEEVKFQIRKDCGFGCVICGHAIIDYHHINPPFKEAKFHDPKNIALLCVGCHGRVSRGIWSNERVITARKKPQTFKIGHAKDAFDFLQSI